MSNIVNETGQNSKRMYEDELYLNREKLRYSRKKVTVDSA